VLVSVVASAFLVAIRAIVPHGAKRNNPFQHTKAASRSNSEQLLQLEQLDLTNTATLVYLCFGAIGAIGEVSAPALSAVDLVARQPHLQRSPWLSLAATP
jgi:hypothetical protein